MACVFTCVRLRVYMFICRLWKGRPAFGCPNWNPIPDWHSGKPWAWIPPDKHFYFYSLIRVNLECEHELRCTKNYLCYSNAFFLCLLYRNFRLFRAWAALDSHPLTAANQACPLPPLRLPANQIQTSPLCPIWDWSHGRKWKEMRRKRIPLTRNWIATLLVAWTRGPGLL